MHEQKSVETEVKTSTRLRLFIPYTTPELTKAALASAAGFARKLRASVTLVSVHIVPFPNPVNRPTVDPEHLKHPLREAIREAPVPVRAVLVYARDHDTGYRRALAPASLVLIASRRRWWTTKEQKLARRLERAGHSVAVLAV